MYMKTRAVVVCGTVLLTVAQSKAQLCVGWSADPGGGTDESVWVAAILQGNLFISGEFSHAGGIPIDAIAKWSGSSWQPVGDLEDDLGVRDNAIYGLAEFGGDIYAAGAFDGSEADIARWDGQRWHRLGEGLSSFANGWGRAMVEYQDELVVGGDFEKAGPLWVDNIAAWNGSSWRILDGGTFWSGNSAGSVWALAEFEERLIAGGFFLEVAGVPARYVAAWDGADWSAMGSGLDEKVNTLAVHDGELYAGGEFRETGDGRQARGVARWDGHEWQPVGTRISIGNGWVNRLESYQGRLYASGWFGDYQDEFQDIAVFDGVDWQPVGEGVSGGRRVSAMATFGTELIVGGEFTHAGGIPSPNLARYRCVACPADFNEDGAVNTQDIIVFLNAWVAGDPRADFNSDGVVNTIDVLNFLNAWAAGC
ncbi:MAG: GC-type dockerin domain-anchored protein [Phycisphaerales bacterium JB054]